MAMNWRCPFCNRDTTVVNDRMSVDVHWIRLDNKLGVQGLHTLAIACPNDQCKELFLLASLSAGELRGNNYVFTKGVQEAGRWELRPQGKARPMPSYIPKAIADDYREACLIRSLSPKASATLARRCLQGMIRNYWAVTGQRNLDGEIKAIKDKIDPATWGAIDAVRQVGNIGAHMEKDIDLIVDVEPQEAELLIKLIEDLIDDWYVARFERAERLEQITKLAAAKKEAKKNGKPADAQKQPEE